MSLTLAAASLIGAGISAAGSLVGNIFNRSSASNINDQNIAFQREENRITREREDTAVQRAAADMQAAGLSKTLAAGNPASAASLTAPQVQQLPKYESALEKLNLGQRILDIELAKKKIEEQDANIDNIKANTEGINISNKFAFDKNEADLKFKRSEVQVNESIIKLNNVRSDLVQKESENFVRKLDAEIDKILAETSLTNANRSKVFEQILTEVKARGLIDKQNDNLVISYLNSKLNYDINSYNLDYAKLHMKPVNYNYGTTDATILALLGGLLKSGLGSGSSTSFNPAWL